MLDYAGIKIKWLGHASFKISNKKIIYIDPYQIEETEAADIILITHDHYDHCSKEDVAKILKDDTVIITPSDCAKKIVGNTRTIKPGERVEIDEIIIDAVPAYNIGKRFHPKENGWVGFVITIDGKKIYHAGDSDLIPEMDKIRADIALLPVGGTYTMNAEEAALAANKIKPEIAVPMHWGSIIGSKEDAEQFRKLCECEVKVLREKE